MVQDKQDGRTEQTTTAAPRKAVKPQRLQLFGIIGTPYLPPSPRGSTAPPTATPPHPPLNDKLRRYTATAFVVSPRTLRVFLTDRINLIGPIK